MRRVKESNSLKIIECSKNNVSQPALRTSSLAFSELVPWTKVEGIRRVVRNKAVPGPTTSRRRPSGARPPAGPARAQKITNLLRASRRVHQHRLQAEFVLLGGEEEEGGGHRSGSGSRGEKGARASRVVGTSSARARASPRANPRARSRGRTAPSRLVAFPRSDTLNLGGGALTVSWLRSLVHHLWVFVGCSQFFLLRA